MGGNKITSQYKESESEVTHTIDLSHVGEDLPPTMETVPRVAAARPLSQQANPRRRQQGSVRRRKQLQDLMDSDMHRLYAEWSWFFPATTIEAPDPFDDSISWCQWRRLMVTFRAELIVFRRALLLHLDPESLWVM